MALDASDSNLARVAYEREVAFDVPNATFNAQISRITSSSLAANKETVTSDELRADRMVGDLVETAFTSGGDLGFELSLGGTWDDFLESLLGGTYQGQLAASGSLTVVAATQTFTLVGAFTDSFVGQRIHVGGAVNAGNNGWHVIATVTDADNVTVTTPIATLVDETFTAEVDSDGHSIAFTGTVSVTAATQTVVATGAFAGAIQGQAFHVSGLTNAGNNGWHRIATLVDDDTVTVTTDVADLADESATATLLSKMLRNPGDPANIVKRSYNIEQLFTDIDVGQLYTGQRLGAMSLSTAANALVSGTWTFQGAQVAVQEDPGEFADSVVQPTGTDVIGATANVARIDMQGVPLQCLVQSLDLTVDNALRNQNAVGSKFPCGIGYGRQNVSGTLVLYFQDLSAYNIFLNHTDVAIQWDYVDNAGNALQILIPRAKFSTDTPSPDGIDTDVLESMDFQAIAYDPQIEGVDPYQIEITIANVG